MRDNIVKRAGEMLTRDLPGPVTAFTVGSPQKLFDQQMAIQWNPGTGSLNYDVSADGRFVMVIPTGRNHELEVVLNWLEELKRLVPAN